MSKITPSWKIELNRKARNKIQTKLYTYGLPRSEDLRENKQMTTIKEMAQAYEPKTTKNISEIAKFPISAEIKTVEYTKKEDGTTFTVNEAEILGEVYRVPTSVIEQIKTLVADDESLEFVKVLKSGNGLNTKYQVLPVKDE